MNRGKARKLREVIEQASASLPDETALEGVELFPIWEPGRACVSGERLRYHGKLYRVIQPHNSQPDWTPDKVPALFVKISLEEWKQWEQPAGAHDAYMKGAKVSDEGKHWISNKDYNIYKPGLVPGDWSEVA